MKERLGIINSMPKYSVKDILGELAEKEEYLHYLKPVVAIFSETIKAVLGIVVTLHENVSDTLIEIEQTNTLTGLKRFRVAKTRTQKQKVMEIQQRYMDEALQFEAVITGYTIGIERVRKLYKDNEVSLRAAEVLHMRLFLKSLAIIGIVIRFIEGNKMIILNEEDKVIFSCHIDINIDIRLLNSAGDKQ